MSLARATVRLSARSTPARMRCAWCHGPFEGAAVHECAGCRTRRHVECVACDPRCPTLGCGREAAVVGRGLLRSLRGLGRPRLVMLLAGLAVLAMIVELGLHGGRVGLGLVVVSAYGFILIEVADRATQRPGRRR